VPIIPGAADGGPAVAYCLLDRHGSVRAERAPDQVFYAASTVKLGVMLAVALAAEAGELTLEDRLPCDHEFVSGVRRPGSDAEPARFRVAPEDADERFPAAGETASIAELTRMMIVRSSNEATNVLFDRLGEERIAAAFARGGAVRSRMQRKIGDSDAIAAGLTNEVTAAELARLMHAIVTGSATGAGPAAWMRAVLAGQEHRLIADVVHPGIPWGSKSGNVPGIAHDVAFVGDPGSEDVRFLAICTRGFEPEQGRETLVAVAQAVLGLG
jgi:beta-lactamase class A